MENIILRLPDVISRTGLSRSSIYNAIKNGAFPQHVSLGERAVGWLSSEIDSWIASRVSKRMPANVVKESPITARRITRRAINLV